MRKSWTLRHRSTGWDHPKPSRRKEVLIGLFAILVSTIFSGCASLPLKEETPSSIHLFPAYTTSGGEAISPASAALTIPDVDILLLTDPMKSLLNESVAGIKDPKKRLDALVAVLVQKVRYDTETDTYGARTASETFQMGTGNCLSFSNLFVAMARYVGLKSVFEEIPTMPNWVRNGDVVFSTRHMGASVDVLNQGNRTVQIDYEKGNKVVMWQDMSRYLFAPTRLDPSTPGINPFSIRSVSDERAFAQYYNNIGARCLSEGKGADAFRYFVKAITTDPKLGFAWSNLGVAYRKNHQLDAAKAAFLTGLSLSHEKDDPTAMSIMGSLARLYTLQGEKEEAQYYEKEVAVFRTRNPYWHYFLGRTAYGAAQYAEAVDHFRDAVRRKEDEPLFYYALFMAYLRIGDIERAERSIDRAKYYAWDDAQKNFYEGARERLIYGVSPSGRP